MKKKIILVNLCFLVILAAVFLGSIGVAGNDMFSGVAYAELEKQKVVSKTAAGNTVMPTGSRYLEELFANLSLNDFVRLVKEKNERIIFRQLDLEISSEMIQNARSIFEPEFVGTYKYEENTSKNTIEEALSRSALAEFAEHNNNYSAAVEGLVPTGGKLSVGYTLRDTANNLQPEETYGKEFKSFLGVTLTQPLLKNRGKSVTMAGIHVAEYDKEIAFQAYRDEMIKMVATGAAAYWDLHLAQEKYEVRKESVRIAEQILRDNRERVRAGKMAETEVLEAEAGLAKRKAMESAAKQNVVVAQNNIHGLIMSTTEDTSKNIMVTDELAVENVTLDFADSLRRALRYRADYLTSMKKVDQEGIRVAYAENQRWPQLDLNASYGLNGLDTSAEDAWNDDLGGKYNSWTVGVEFRLPLLSGRKSRSELQAAKYRKKQALMEVKAIEVAMANNIDTSIRNANSAKDQVKNYSRAVEYNSRLLEVELLRFKAGQSNSRIVLEREDILNTSKEEMLDGLVNLKKALVEHGKAEGSLLQGYGIEVMEIANNEVVSQ
ncbi:MAG: TolC family protein [Desulfobulbaceae bacterium]|nr:TolC family protein [Desulfobulbaceae bacterium]